MGRLSGRRLGAVNLDLERFGQALSIEGPHRRREGQLEPTPHLGYLQVGDALRTLQAGRLRWALRATTDQEANSHETRQA